MKNRIASTLLAVFLTASFGIDVVALTIKGDEAHVKTAGALQDGAWNLWCDGEWGGFLRFEKPGAYRVRMLCFGSPVDGGWPIMSLSIDGDLGKAITVATNKPTEYVFTCDIEAGIHRVGVAFLNDQLTKTEDRNLYIVSMSIEALDNKSEVALSSEEEWRAQWSEKHMKAENAVLAKAARAIEKNRKSAAVVCVTDEEGRPLKGADVAIELKRHDFLFGCNIYMFDQFGTPRENDLYKDAFKGLFNYATVGFYWKAYEQERGKPNYDYTDKVVNWCIENQISMKGHPLLWACEHGIPPWSQEQPPAEVRKKRVDDIMTRYAGKIKSWEVLNEPSHLSGLTIDEPYLWARKADPKARLIVNDYDVLLNGYPPFFQLLKDAQGRGIPFDGIGIQAHEPRTMRFPLEKVWSILDEYATLGKELHITEFTPTSGGLDITGSYVTGKWDESAQADYAVKFYTVSFAHPAVKAITWWDLCDSGAWLEGGGLLRKDLSPKPAYVALSKLLREQWTTKVEAKTDGKGKVSFSGFHGDYDVRITSGEKTVMKSFHLGKQDEKGIKIVLSNKP